MNYGFNEPAKLAKAVKKLSDYFIQEENKQTPWNEDWGKAAYLAYFFPLNFVRLMKVVNEVQRLKFLEDNESIIDLGAGMGTASLALLNAGIKPKKIQLIDSSNEALKYFNFFHPSIVCQIEKTTDDVSKHRLPLQTVKHATLIASYAINEWSALPKWFFDAKKIILVEPSTKKEGRNLQGLRQELINNGYYIWAPCIHQNKCPLLATTKDWCHDRAHWSPPEWFLKIEEHLPMKNNTLPFSYLIASKSPPAQTEAKIRIVGDERIEKGKTRWLACRNEEREFLSWMNKWGNMPDWKRGDLVNVGKLEKKGNELRPQLEKK